MLFLIVALFLISCNSGEKDDLIMTVNGAIFSSDMGVTLSHEHVMVDWIGADSTGYHRWNRDEVVERALPYFLEARKRGIDTIAEATPAYLGRDPFILAEISRLSGVQILTNTGFYGAVDNRFIPGYVYDETADEIAARWIDEFENGIDGSDVRPGFIKISVAEERSLTTLHQKLVEAAAITHLQTGLTILSHTIGDLPALEQIRKLKEKNVSPKAWVWTHAQSGTMEGNMEAAEIGAWIALDNVNFNPEQEPGGHGSIEWYADRIMRIRDAGFLGQLLISHDAGWYDVGEENGGDFRGYSDLFDYLVPELADRGFSDEEIIELLISNPKKAFGIRVRAL
ncbi:MAG: phosphotriesterase [Balneolaceae bacterium]|nr:MAG: phosphotriesterase [Balneolaceae bacterium]